MRLRALLCITTLVACGDDIAGSDSDSATSTATAGTTDPASASDSESMSASDSEGQTGTTSGGSATDGETSGSTGTTTDETGSSTSGDPTSTTGTGTTGMPLECDPNPVFEAEDVPLNEACDVELQMGTFNPEIEWKYGSTSYAGPVAAGQIVDTNESGAIDPTDMPVVLIYQSGAVIALHGDGSGVAWEAPGLRHQRLQLPLRRRHGRRWPRGGDGRPDHHRLRGQPPRQGVDG